MWHRHRALMDNPADNDIDVLIQDATNFIETVYADLNMIPDRSTVERSTENVVTSGRSAISGTSNASRTRRPPSRQGISSNVLASPRRIAARNLDALESRYGSLNSGNFTNLAPHIDLEANRISRVCDAIDHSLHTALPSRRRNLLSTRRTPHSGRQSRDSPYSQRDRSHSRENPDPASVSTEELIDALGIASSDEGVDCYEDDVVFVSYLPTNTDDSVIDLCSPMRSPRRDLNRVQRNEAPTTNANATNPTRNRNRNRNLTIHNNAEKKIDETDNTKEQDSDTSSGSNYLMCAVCMESCLKREPTTTKCGHIFCGSCIRQCIKVSNKCPLCNTKLHKRMLVRLYIPT